MFVHCTCCTWMYIFLVLWQSLFTIKLHYESPCFYLQSDWGPINFIHKQLSCMRKCTSTMKNNEKTKKFLQKYTKKMLNYHSQKWSQYFESFYVFFNNKVSKFLSIRFFGVLKFDKCFLVDSHRKHLNL